MKVRNVVFYLLKLAVCGVIFAAGVAIGGAVASALGLPAPALPEGTDAATLGQYLLLGSPFLALVLSFLAWGIPGRFVARWLALSLFTWVVYGVNTVVEAAIFTTFSAASWYAVVMYLVAAPLFGAGVAWLFRPQRPGAGVAPRLRRFFAARPGREWAWRLLAALGAFVTVYLVSGWMVEPFVAGYYREGVLELTAPGWSQIIPVQLARSALFLAVCVPVVAAWQGRGLVLSLGLALFLLTALPVLTAYWLPLALRVPHGLELLGCFLVYAWVLSRLLASPQGHDA